MVSGGSRGSTGGEWRDTGGEWSRESGEWGYVIDLYLVILY